MAAYAVWIATDDKVTSLVQWQFLQFFHRPDEVLQRALASSEVEQGKFSPDDAVFTEPPPPTTVPLHIPTTPLQCPPCSSSPIRVPPNESKAKSSQPISSPAEYPTKAPPIKAPAKQNLGYLTKAPPEKSPSPVRINYEPKPPPTKEGKERKVATEEPPSKAIKIDLVPFRAPDKAHFDVLPIKNPGIPGKNPPPTKATQQWWHHNLVIDPPPGLPSGAPAQDLQPGQTRDAQPDQNQESPGSPGPHSRGQTTPEVPATQVDPHSTATTILDSSPAPKASPATQLPTSMEVDPEPKDEITHCQGCHVYPPVFSCNLCSTELCHRCAVIKNCSQGYGMNHEIPDGVSHQGQYYDPRYEPDPEYRPGGSRVHNIDELEKGLSSLSLQPTEDKPLLHSAATILLRISNNGREYEALVLQRNAYTLELPQGELKDKRENEAPNQYAIRMLQEATGIISTLKIMHIIGESSYETPEGTKALTVMTVSSEVRIRSETFGPRPPGSKEITWVVSDQFFWYP